MLGNLTMVFARTVGYLTKIFSKSQIPGVSPRGEGGQGAFRAQKFGDLRRGVVFLLA
jgi:hypothetical protein